jgi:hypothetical protein
VVAQEAFDIDAASHPPTVIGLPPEFLVNRQVEWIWMVEVREQFRAVAWSGQVVLGGNVCCWQVLGWDRWHSRILVHMIYGPKSHGVVVSVANGSAGSLVLFR